MSDRQDTGRRGQRAAKKYLEYQGYTILQEHYRFSRAEIDIIAAKEDWLIAVEVKTLSVSGDTRPDLPVQVSEGQSRRISHALAEFAYEMGHEGSFRFDMIQVYDFGCERTEVEHYEEVWFPR